MKPEYINRNVRARCSDCGGAVTTFEYQEGGREFGSLVLNGIHEFGGIQFDRVVYMLMRCAGCGKGGLAEIHDYGNVSEGVLGSFLPTSIQRANIPDGVPEGIVAEFREAELCASVGAFRGASALLRSTLEKTLKENGYVKGGLQDKIEEAGNDGVITAARRQRAQEDIRVLGNDVLHDEWRQITAEEVEAAHHYSQRILEDFYDDRPSVEALLIEKKRLPERAQP